VVFAPVVDLGLVCVWDDGDDLLSDPHAPYPHARDVAAIRVTQRGAGLLLGSYSRTAEVQSWVGRNWLHPIALTADLARTEAPAVRVAADDDFALERDPAARAARLPHQVFSVVRAGLAQGPILVQVPRAGYVVSLSCQTCREPVRCPHCRGRVRTDSSPGSGDPLTTCTWCGRAVLGWSCPNCGGTRWRSTRVGSERTAEELGKAFPGTTVRQSSLGKVLTTVGSEPCLVVATPGAEPVADGGYAAALLLDTSVLLNRPDLRAAEEALRRWFLATALVRPASDGGTVLAVGPSGSRPLQALTRVDPVGFAERELADRVGAELPPAVFLAVAQGEWAALTELAGVVADVPGAIALGPALVVATEDGADRLARLVIRAPLASGPPLVATLRAFLAARSARKDQRQLRIKVDPVDVG
jgi:primosomal protein N' (replication factor Y)